MRIKSDDQRTSSLSLTLMILGSGIIFLINHRAEPRPGEHWAYLGGLLLIILGTYVFLMAEKMVITINTAKQGLNVRRQNKFHQRIDFIPFKDVESVHVVRVGRRAGLKTYHLVLRLAGGRKLTPGRWSHNPSEINDVAKELAQEIGCSIKEAPVYSLPDIKTALLSIGGALAIYAIWYRLTVGQVCLAMWHGTAPAIIVPFGFMLLLFLFRTRVN